MSVITDPSQVTVDWVTSVLARHQLLKNARVSDFSAETVLVYNSTIVRLSLSYDRERAGPASVILKLKDGEGAREEFEFNRAIGPDRAELPMLMPWYDAQYSAELNAAHFLMPDLTLTHEKTVTVDQVTRGRSMPSDRQIEQVIDTIADFHAHWWKHPRLDQSIGPIHGGYRDAHEFERVIMTQRRSNFEAFISHEGTDFPEDLRKLYEHALPCLPVLYQRWLAPRLQSHDNVTLIHGDCYFGQFMCPKNGSGQTILMDLESANTFLAALDLAFLFATFWTREQRLEQDREQRCLRRYHARISRNNFTFDDLLRDYKVAVSLMIFHPIWDKVIGGSSRRYWWPKIQCLTSAYEDLNCAQLTQ